MPHWCKKQLFCKGNAIMFSPLTQKEALCKTGDRNGSNLKERWDDIVYKFHSTQTAIAALHSPSSSIFLFLAIHSEITVQNLKKFYTFHSSLAQACLCFFCRSTVCILTDTDEVFAVLGKSLYPSSSGVFFKLWQALFRGSKHTCTNSIERKAVSTAETLEALTHCFLTLDFWKKTPHFSLVTHVDKNSL